MAFFNVSFGAFYFVELIFVLINLLILQFLIFSSVCSVVGLAARTRAEVFGGEALHLSRCDLLDRECAIIDALRHWKIVSIHRPSFLPLRVGRKLLGLLRSRGFGQPRLQLINPES